MFVTALAVPGGYVCSKVDLWLQLSTWLRCVSLWLQDLDPSEAPLG